MINESVTMADVQTTGPNADQGEPRAKQQQPSMRTMLLMKRKLSTWKNIGTGKAPSTASKDKSSIAPAVRYEPTYRMEPKERFSIRRAEEAMLAGMKFFLASQPGYNATKCGGMTRLLVDDIKQRLKQLGYSRYKLVVQVLLTQKAEQDMKMSSQCVWDVKRDDVATVTYAIKDIMAIATVHAVYCE